jgi:signal transduction histidine kinase
MRRPPASDLLVAGALAAWALAEALLLGGDGSPAVRVAWALAFTLPLAVRRQAPAAVAFCLSAGVLARVLIDQGGAGEEGAMPFPALLTAAYSAAVHARTLPLAIAAGVATYVPLACVVFLGYFSGDAEPADAAILSFFAGAAWAAGYFVRRRGDRAAIESVEAVAGERARIARELHDIIGHSMSVISLQAGAAEQLLKRDPERAEGHLRAVQAAAHEALVEMRRLMGVLREDEAPYAPQPGLGSLDALARDAGLEVEIVVEGAPAALPPAVDLAAYRIVQEALTNARKHAGAQRARVTVRHGERELALTVANPRGRGAAVDGVSGGRGLAGMRERVRVFGGRVEAGPDGDGGFVVRARLPLEPVR